MLEILSKFYIASEIDDNLKNKITLFHVFDDYYNFKNILFVTSDDKVFAFGHNSYGVCGVGQGIELNDTIEVPELNGKSVKQFSHGSTFALALTNDNQVYAWGAYSLGELARGLPSNEYFKPQLINAGLVIKFTAISCGEHHAMTLTTDGTVYAWGDNTFSQIVMNMSKKRKYKDLTRVPLPKIKSIYCSNYQSFAITYKGEVYCWGYNLHHKLPTGYRMFDDAPRAPIDNISRIVAISSSHCNTYFLDEDGDLFFSGRYMIDDSIKYQEFACRVILDGKVISMLANINLKHPGKHCLIKVKTESGIQLYCLVGNQAIRTNYKNYIEYCAEQFETTRETLAITSNINDRNQLCNATNGESLTSLSSIDTIDLNTGKSMTLPNDDPEPRFELKAEIGKGSFGLVRKVLDKSNDRLYAIKVIQIIGINEKIFQSTTMFNFRKRPRLD